MYQKPRECSASCDGIGSLGAIAQCPARSAEVGHDLRIARSATDVEGQLSLEQLRALGFGPRDW